MTEIRFDDGKDAGALRTIGEVSAALDIKTHVLRYWEQQFPMLQPLKRSGGRRYYRPEDVRLVQQIDELVNRRGYTLKGAKQALEAGEGPSVATPAASAAVSQEQQDASYPIPETAPMSVGAPGAGANANEGEDIIPEVIDRLKAIRSELASALKD